MVTDLLPAGFTWGVATASYQIEGAVKDDGRGPSIWDIFSHTPGKIINGDTGDLACDHYHRWAEDIKLMQRLGIRAYRFSIAWPRILPKGTGQVNVRGLEFYDRLIDHLLEAEITPFVTLYHWDLPQALEDRGGWANRATVDAYVTFVDVVAHRLGDRVKNWITFNEPWVSAFRGYYEGVHAPGIRDLATAVKASHHQLLSHGRSVPVLRDASKGARVGITLNLSPIRPFTQSTEDQVAAQRYDGYINRWFLDPVFGRGYPADMLDIFGPHLATGATTDTNEMGKAIDFLGINYYSPIFVKANEGTVSAKRLSPEELAPLGYELTEMGWPVDATGLAELLGRVHKDYTPKSIYITENGCALDDKLVEGKVDDLRRIHYLDEHLRAALKAIHSGVPIQGYFLWSLMDNFEWAFGYTKRFGIVYTDYPSQKRIPKESFNWYKGVIARNGL